MSEIVTWAWSVEKQEMVHIDSVQNGHKCGCICRNCKQPLNARQGKVNEHSFAHQKEDGECQKLGESSIHQLAKQLISREKKIMLPPLGNISQGIKYFEKVETEVFLKEFGLRPDIIGIDEKGEKWAIEIYYSNPKSESEKAKYVKAQIKCLEIDVNNINLCQDEDASELRNFLFDTFDNRKWIFPVNFQNDIYESSQTFKTSISYPSSGNKPKVHRLTEKQHSNVSVPSTNIIEEKIDYKDELYISELDNESWSISDIEYTGKISEELLSQLNDNQREAVEYCDGPSLVIAGAGSGKTRVLTYKIAGLLQLGLKPWNILALTFTNKAAQEMKERIGKLVGTEQARYLNMGTFHSVFSHILRAESNKIGYAPNFTIYDQSDARSLVKTIIKEMGLDDKIYKASSVADRISMAKNHILLPNQYANSAWAADDAQQKRPATSKVYIRYAQRCRQANAMDFDDLLVNTYMLLKNYESIRRKYANRFKYVLVDEYQDTNAVQQAIVTLLTKDEKRQRVCVVGDDAQSIYSFRGANIDNILNYQNEYPNVKLFKLEQNYRSTQLIVQAANSLIRKNERQIPKDVYSRNEEGELLTLKPAYSDREEALIVCQDIKRLRREDKCSYSDFAILYRTNAQSRSFEEQMRKDNIPYRIYGGLSFYQRKEIKDVIAYFRLVANPDDEEAFKRIVNYPTRGIGNTTIDKIVSTANNYGVSLWRVISDPVLFPLEVNKGTLAKIDAFRQLIDGWRQRLTVEDAYQLGHDIIMTSGISRDIYGSHNPEDISRQENLEEFLSGMQDFVEGRREEDMGDQVYLTDFLQEVALLTDLDSDDGDENDKVVLMTIHAAKGLEFPTVFVVGLEENIFPSPMCTNSMRELEEERRLLYVAITRAEKHCILTCAQNRFRYGRMEYDTPSRFIKDFDPQLIRVVSEKGGDSFDRRDSFGRKDIFSSADGYTRGLGETTSRGSQWMQNPRPVATQFRADPKPRAVAPRQPEKPVEPFSDSFKRTLQTASGGRFRPVGRAVAPRPMASEGGTLTEGAVIEHQRFGVGRVMKLEGIGENQKATVEFKNAGTKQLLLKFARYKVIG